MKQNKKENLRRKARKIAELENELNKGKNVKINQDKIYSIMCHLNLDDLLYIEDYIDRKKLLDKNF